MSIRLLFLLISLLTMNGLAVGQVRVRDSSDTQQSLSRIKKGIPKSEPRFELDLHQFQRTCGFSEGLAYVMVNRKWGFIDQTGTVVIEPQFSDAGCFRSGLAPVEKGGKWGYIDRKGHVVIDLTWDWASEFYEGRALVMSSERWGYIDKNGSVIIKPQFDLAHSFSDGLALVAMRPDPKEPSYIWGYVDANGEWIIRLGKKPVYHPVGSFKDGLAYVHILKGYHHTGGVIVEDGFIDESGAVVMEPAVDGQIAEFHEGLAQLRVGSRPQEKFGFLNTDGSIVIEPKFDNAWHFSEGLVQVAIEKKWGFADKHGTLVIKPQFDSTRYFPKDLLLSRSTTNGDT